MVIIRNIKKLSWIYFIILVLSSCKGDPVDPGTDPDPDLGPNPIFSCDDCDYIVKTHETNGIELNFKAGDVVCLQTGKVYDNILFTEIIGEQGNPIIIRNCGGTAVIKSTGSFGVKFKGSKYFKFLGDGGGDSKYGIVITTAKSFYLSMEYFTTDFEIAYVEIAGNTPNDLHGSEAGFAGIGVKTSPYVACGTFTDPSRTAWIMENVSLHDNYIHDTGGEGMYIGHGFYKGRQEAGCPSKTYSHSIQNLRVFNNIIENTGYDGIQIKNADRDVEIYNNVISGYGLRNENAHNEGLFLGEGVTGKLYNNIVMNGTGHGIQFQGMGNNDIYGNVVYNSGGYGFYGAHGNFVVRIPGGYFNIMNNTFVNSGEYGFVFFNEDGGPKRLINNIIAGAVDGLIRSGAPLEKITNLLEEDDTAIGFLDLANGDLRLTAGSPAIDAGTDVSQYLDLKSDVFKTDRPKGAAVDIGAIEFKN